MDKNEFISLCVTSLLQGKRGYEMVYQKNMFFFVLISISEDVLVIFTPQMAKWAEEQRGKICTSRLIFWVLDHFSVHTALRLGQRCSWHGRREKGWQPQWTALVLTKGALEKRKEKKTLHIMPTLLFYTLDSYCVFFFFTQGSADVRYAKTWNYLQYRNGVPIPFLFSFVHVGLCALCTAGSTSPVLTLSSFLVIFIYEIHLHCLFDILPCILLLVSPSSPFFLNLILTFFYSLLPVSHSLCGSAVTLISFCWRMSFQRGTGSGLCGGSSLHARTLVNRTMWLYSKERLYRRRHSEEFACDQSISTHTQT